MHRTILYVFTSIICLFAAASYAEAAVIFRPVFHAGLAGYWDFNEGEGNTAYDRSGNSRHGSLTNMQPQEDWVNSKSGLGQALEFDGEDAYVAIGDAGSGIQTISFWMYAHDTTTRDIIDLDGTDQIQLNGSSQITATDFPAATIYVDGKVGSTVTPNTWHHVLITDTVGVNATALEIGRVTTSNEFDGLIDDVRLYTRVLTPDEVRRTYNIAQPRINVTRTIIADGLVGHWSFDGGVTGPTWTDDISGNGNAGTLVGGPKPTSGRIGQVLEFDGDDDYVDLNTAVLTAAPLTMCAWAKSDRLPSDVGAEQTLVIINDGASSQTDFFNLRLDNADNKIEFSARQNGAGSAVGAEGQVITPGVWQFYCAVAVSSSERHIYMNAELGGTNTATIVPAGLSETYIGSYVQFDQGFDGLIDDVRIYNRALSDHEIKRLYDGTKPQEINTTQSTGSLADGLAGHWSFDGPDTGPTWTDDVSGNGNSGTLTNGPKPTSGRIGQGMEFDGDDDYVDAASATSLDNVFAGGGTWAAWVYPRALASGAIPGIIGKTFFDTATHGSALQLCNNNVTFCSGVANTISFFRDFTTGIGEWRTPANSVTLNGWQHIAVVYDDSSSGNDPIIYVNGVSQPVTELLAPSGSSSGDAAGSLWIGDAEHVSVNFNGILDDVRLYNRALTSHEIQRLSNQGHGQ